MTVDFSADAITLSGKCGIEEVETLVGYLESHPHAAVDVAAATEIHTALWQTLMVFGPDIFGVPASPSAVDRLLPGLIAASGNQQKPRGKLADLTQSQ